MLFYLTKDQVEDLHKIAQDKLERVAIPGSWRAYKVDNAVVIEIYNEERPKCLVP